MKVNKEKLEKIISDDPVYTAERNRQRILNRSELRKSRVYAMKLLNIMEITNLTKYRLSLKIGISKTILDNVVQGKKVISSYGEGVEEKIEKFIDNYNCNCNL